MGVCKFRSSEVRSRGRWEETTRRGREYKYVQWRKLTRRNDSGEQNWGEDNQKKKEESRTGKNKTTGTSSDSTLFFFLHTNHVTSSSAVSALRPRLQPYLCSEAFEAGVSKKNGGQMRKEVKHSTQRRREAEQLVFGAEWRRVSFTLSQQISGGGSLAIPGLPRLMFREA